MSDSNDPIERLKAAASKAKAASDKETPTDGGAKSGFARRVSRVVTKRKSHNIHGPLDPDPVIEDNEVSVSYGDEVTTGYQDPTTLADWFPNTDDISSAEAPVDGQARLDPHKWSDVAADIVYDHYSDGLTDEQVAAKREADKSFFEGDGLSEIDTTAEELAASWDKATPVGVAQSDVARPSGRSHDLKSLQVVGATLLGPNGQQISATINSLGQPRSMSPEEAHQKLTQLRIYTRSYWDAQKHRIKIGNRAFSGVTDVETIKDIRDSAKRTEELLSKALIKNFKDAFPEIYAWTEETPGLGPVLMGRLLGEIGHPCWAFPSHWEGRGETRKLVSDAPFMRNPAKLWAYCGVGDPKRRPFKGMTDRDVYAMGNPKAKMLVHLLAESCMKQQGTGNRRRSPYRDTYDVFRARYEDRMETKVNKKTGKEETKPWSDGHKHNAALRVTGKEILLDLWVLAERAL